MTALMLAPELQLPWESTVAEDRRFRQVLRAVLAVFAIVAVALPLLPVTTPELEIQEEEKPPLARIILEEQALPEPPPPLPRPVPVVPKPAPKPEPRKVVPVEPLVKPPPKPQPTAQQKLEQARKDAAVAGVLAFQDDLQALRDTVDVASLDNTQLSRGEASAASTDRSLITQAARTSSGGVRTADLSQDAGGAALSGREATRVVSSMGGQARGTARGDESGSSAQAGGRSDAAIREVMDRNKGAIFAIYNRALRNDPLLEGKLMFEMVIEPAGTVSDIVVLDSELSDEALTRKIIARVRLINFGTADVLPTRVNYSFDFLPFS
tara:strand:- start:116798 stop:117769 length:972 start_codon:yes stop_codon:yes gene_type:complete